MDKRYEKQSGSVNVWMILSIIAILAVIGLAVLSVWAYTNYIDQKTNVDSKITLAVATAKKEQADTDAAKYSVYEKSPYRQLVGPDDYGHLTINYPRTWSAYIAQDASNGGDYEAYLNPESVPPVSGSQIFALRITIEDKDYETAVDEFSSLVESGDLTSKSVKIDNSTGVRFDGKFSDDLRGSLVLFKIRDKTLTVRTDAQTFTDDFDKAIDSIKFNQ